MRHFAISAANFSISTLVLQTQNSFKHKRRFSQVHKHKNQIKAILQTVLSTTHTLILLNETCHTCSKFSP